MKENGLADGLVIFFIMPKKINNEIVDKVNVFLFLSSIFLWILGIYLDW